MFLSDVFNTEYNAKANSNNVFYSHKMLCTNKLLHHSNSMSPETSISHYSQYFVESFESHHEADKLEKKRVVLKSKILCNKKCMNLTIKFS